MPVTLVFEPGKTVKWDEVSSEGDPPLIEYPECSISVDGHCDSPPNFYPERKIMNVDHHDGCNRIATRSSCAQMLHLVRMGLFDTFSLDGKPHATAYFNGCDEDVAFASYSLLHPDCVDHQLFRELVNLEDLLDMSSGLYPVKSRWHLLRRLLWICEPYQAARARGADKHLTAAQMEDLVLQMHGRISATLEGEGHELEPDVRYEVIEQFEDWAFINEVGVHARLGVGQDGLKAFVSWKGCVDGLCHYIAARRSPLIGWFPLHDMCDALNRGEGIMPDAASRWGGNYDTIIGSPREVGSLHKPEAVLEIVKSCIRR